MDRNELDNNRTERLQYNILIDTFCHFFLCEFSCLSDATDVVFNRIVIHKQRELDCFWTKVSYRKTLVKQENPAKSKQNLLKKKKFV